MCGSRNGSKARGPTQQSPFCEAENQHQQLSLFTRLRCVSRYQLPIVQLTVLQLTLLLISSKLPVKSASPSCFQFLLSQAGAAYTKTHHRQFLRTPRTRFFVRTLPSAQQRCFILTLPGCERLHVAQSLAFLVADSLGGLRELQPLAPFSVSQIVMGPCTSSTAAVAVPGCGYAGMLLQPVLYLSTRNNPALATSSAF